MNIFIQRIKKHLIWGVLSALICFATAGCLLESTFNLASDSRLPRWITLPAGLTRADTSLTISYYTTPWGGTAQFILRDKNKQTIEKKSGEVRCAKPLQLKTPPRGFPPGYPNYAVVTVNGVTEILEQKRPEDILYVTDEPAIWKQYRESGCD
jgi:hypothetical protein